VAIFLKYKHTFNLACDYDRRIIILIAEKATEEDRKRLEELGFVEGANGWAARYEEHE